AMSSQSAGVYLAPFPTTNDRATSSSVRGQSPSPYVTSVGCSAQFQGPPLPVAVRFATIEGVRYTGSPLYICADGIPSARSAAANFSASSFEGANHVMDEAPSPSVS